MLEVKLVLVFGSAVNTVLLLLSSREILWNCFRGAFKPLWLEMLFSQRQHAWDTKAHQEKKRKTVPPPTIQTFWAEMHLFVELDSQSRSNALWTHQITYCSTLLWWTALFSLLKGLRHWFVFYTTISYFQVNLFVLPQSPGLVKTYLTCNCSQKSRHTMLLKLLIPKWTC